MDATLTEIMPGCATVVLERNSTNTQQHGFVHGGAISAIADTAAGYSAPSLTPSGRGVLTTEFKINFVSPAAGERVVARGKAQARPDPDPGSSRGVQPE